MFRFVCPILLIVNLLSCPSRCMSCQAATASVNGGVPAGCSCCHCKPDSPVSESSEDSPSDDCLCPNCICEGATLRDSLELPGANTQEASFGYWSAASERDVTAVIMQEFARETKDDNRYNCGRDARIAHHSWLI